jgi:transcriptional regulator with XRE-family HTH domain
MTNLKEDVGKRLKESRQYAGLTQRQAAEHLGILQPAYARYESGAVELDYQKITELCKLFDVSSDYLLGLRDEYNQKLK